MEKTNKVLIIKHSSEGGPHLKERFSCLYNYAQEDIQKIPEQVKNVRSYVEAIISEKDLQTIQTKDFKTEVEPFLKKKYYQTKTIKIYEKFSNKISKTVSALPIPGPFSMGKSK